MRSILDDLDLLGESQQPPDGKPLQLSLTLIDEDPDQPRREFEQTTLAELAETINARGVRSPISVRPHPAIQGRWMLNFGSRRLRASKLAGLSEIPAFVDTCADSYDQVIENEQREPLTPLELALFVQRRQALGETQKEIGQRLGKSQSFVMFTTALIDPPDWLIDAYRDGRCRGLKELYDLRRLHREHPREVELWVSGQEAAPVTRRTLDELRDTLEQRPGGAGQAGPLPTETESAAQTGVNAGASAASACTTQATSRQATAPARSAGAQASPARLLAEADGAVLVIYCERVPAEAGMVYVAAAGGGQIRAVPAATLKLVGFAKVCD